MNEQTLLSLLKWMDQYIGYGLSWVLPLKRHHAKPVINPPKTIVLIKFWGLGSITLSLPLIKSLKQQYPSTKIVFVTLDKHREHLELCPLIDTILSITIKTPFHGIYALYNLTKTLRNHAPDMILDLEFFSYTTALLTWLSKAPIRQGFSAPERPYDRRKKYYSNSIRYNRHQHMSQQFLNFSPNPNTKIIFPSFQISTAMTTLSKESIILNINASNLAPERRWPLSYFVALCNLIVTTTSAPIVLIGDQSETHYTEQFLAQITTPERVQNTCGQLSINDLIQVIKQCLVLISNDSGPIHIASALNKPTIGFYGPESPKRFGPLATSQLVFYNPPSCGPCLSPENLKESHCHYQQQCLTRFTPERVWPQIKIVIEELEMIKKYYVRQKEKSDIASLT